MTSIERITAPAPSVGLVLEDDPRIVTRDGEIVRLAEATVGDLGRFVADLRAMRRVVDDALVAVAAEVGERADSAGTRTLREGGVVVTIDADTETVFSLDAALAELRDLLRARTSSGSLLAVDAALDDLLSAVEAIERVKVVREPDHAAIKRLRARGDRDVNAVLDKHTTTRPKTRRTVKVEEAT